MFFKNKKKIADLEQRLSLLKESFDDFIFGKTYLILRVLTANIDYVICRKVNAGKNLSNGNLTEDVIPIFKKIFYSPILEPLSDEFPALWTKERWEQEGYVLWGEKYPYAVFVNEKDMFKMENSFLNQEDIFS